MTDAETVSPRRSRATIRPRRDRFLVYALLLPLIAVPLVIWDGVIDYNLGKAAILLVLLPGLTMIWGFDLRASKGGALQLPWLLLPMALLGVVALFSLIYAANRPETIQSLLIGLLFVQFLLITTHSVRTETDASLLVGALLLAGGIASLIALLQYSGIVQSVSERVGPNRMTSTFGNQNYLGSFLACLIFPSAALILNRGSRIRRAVAAAGLAFVLSTAFLIDQMGILFALIAGSGAGVVLTVFAGTRRKQRLWRPLGLFLFVAVASATIIAVRLRPDVPAKDDRNAVQRLLEENSIDARILFWSVALRMFADRPLTGIGLGNYRMLYTPYEAKLRSSYEGGLFPEVETRTEVAHNDFVQIAAELGVGGILGTIGFLVILAWAVWMRLAAASSDPPQRTTWILLLAAGLVVFLAHGLVDFPLHLPVSSLAAVVLLALLFSPITGEAGVFRVRPSGMCRRAIVAAALLIASTGAVFAVREVAGYVLMKQGVRQLNQGDPETAVVTLARSVDLRFSPRCAVYYLATAQAQSDLYDAALANFERCFSCCTADHVYLFYADLSSQLGNIGPARDAIETLLATLPPTDIRLRAELVRAQIEHLAGNNTLAIELLDRLLESNPYYRPAHAALARILIAQGDLSAVREHYEAALVLIDEQVAALKLPLSSAPAASPERANLAAQIQALDQERAQLVAALRELLAETAP